MVRAVPALVYLHRTFALRACRVGLSHLLQDATEVAADRSDRGVVWTECRLVDNERLLKLVPCASQVAKVLQHPAECVANRGDARVVWRVDSRRDLQRML